jgi:hypothetical protein
MAESFRLGQEPVQQVADVLKPTFVGDRLRDLTAKRKSAQRS